VLTRPSAQEPAGVRILLVIGAEALFATLTDLVTGAPPSFLAIVALGMGMALGLEWQVRAAGPSARR
jgi:hypothetical protein